MLFKFHTCTLNRVYGYVRVQLVANSFEPLYTVQCPMYCTGSVSNVLYSVQCTLQCPMYCTVSYYCTMSNVLRIVLYSVWRR